MTKNNSYIGSVQITYGSDSTEYSDGNYEDILKSFFNSKPSPPNESRILEFLSNNDDWPIIYHLSPLRKSLVSWYNFKPKSSLLEVGAGCGAITEVFLDKCSNVTALELTKKRAEILASRYRDRNNLQVHVGNLQDYKPLKAFDYVTSIGVLEYSGAFIDSNEPYSDFLKMCRSKLKSSGTLILAIENRLGLKYWAGAREDHTWRFFDSIEGYPIERNKKTFSKNELTELLKKSGFNNLRFYYPIPDMKLPTEIYSEKYTPNSTTFIKPTTIPSPALDAPRVDVFNEWLALNTLSNSDDFGLLSNSFLVFAS